MKQLNLLLFLLLPLLYSCKSDCDNLECLSEDAFAFTIKSSETGEDLLFGDSPQLTKDNIEVYYTANGTRQAASMRLDMDYALVGLDREVQTYYVTALDKTDTIQVVSSTIPSSECCPSTTVIEKITVNGTAVPEDTWVIDLFR
ncbi:hypothetical protein [Pontibacter roseus]|uniref:hypothetical protein n=1 Tax=Pontibacter roseus TaxID=336989 RepID=UPI00036003B4|nr:hypothetical protein [Pontibacter roseus]